MAKKPNLDKPEFDYLKRSFTTEEAYAGKKSEQFDPYCIPGAPAHIINMEADAEDDLEEYKEGVRDMDELKDIDPVSYANYAKVESSEESSEEEDSGTY